MHIAYQMDITIPGNKMFLQNLDFLIFLQQGNSSDVWFHEHIYAKFLFQFKHSLNTLDLEQLNF